MPVCNEIRCYANSIQPIVLGTPAAVMESAPQREAHALQMEQALTEMRRPTITLQPLQDNTLHQRRKVSTAALPCAADPQRLNAEDEARVPPSQAPAPASLAPAPAALAMVSACSLVPPVLVTS